MGGSDGVRIEQPSLDLRVRPARRRGRGRPAARRADGAEIAEELPVARVAVALGLAHLDRLFDYLVPASLDAAAQPGVRVKVRFAGRDLDGFVVERTDEAEHAGRLEPIRKVVSPEPVLLPQIYTLARAVADSHVGSLDDVLRLAIPPRHATAERELTGRPTGSKPTVESTQGSAAVQESLGAPVDVGRRPDEGPVVAAPIGPWERYPAGASLLRHLAAGRSPAAAWTASPSEDDAHDWPAALAYAAAATLASGRGAVVVVPDRRDVDRVDAAFAEVLGLGRHVRLTADQGPQARYTAWLTILRGHVRCVVGTRAAAFAPVHDLGLVAWWSDGDDLLAEPRAPYPHVRDVLRLRREIEGAGLLVGGFTRTAYVQAWVEQGWIPPIGEDPGVRRRRCAPVIVAGEGRQEERYGPGANARLPSLAWRVAKEALDRGPVLVQVPRRGYLPALACGSCGLPARCPDCHGPMSLSAPEAASGTRVPQAPAQVPTCRYCGIRVPHYECPHCEASALRASVVGAERTAEELGRAFPGVPVRSSTGAEVKATVPGAPALVVATPGAEPVAESGYAATLLLDAWAGLDQPRLDAGEQALSRWMLAAALTRPRDADGCIVLAGVPESPALTPVEALVRWAPEWFAERELTERRGLDLPPSAWLAKMTGSFGAVTDALAQADLTSRVPSVCVAGPWPLDPGDARAAAPEREAIRTGHGAGGALIGADVTVAERPAQALITCDPKDSQAVCAALATVRVTRGARKETGIAVRVGSADAP